MQSTARAFCCLALVGSFSVPLLLARPGFAQQFPTKPIRIISTTSAGGVNDTLCRTFAHQISQSIGHPVVVENRPGAGSIIGMLALAKSPPDGYTVALTTPEPLVFNPFLYSKLPYDPDHDFTPVTQVGRSESVIAVNGAVPGNTFPEVMAYAKANPGKLNFATWGAASPPALYLAWINRQNGVNMVGIAYKGAPPSIAALVSGEVQMTYMAMGFILAQIKAGKLKAVAMAGNRRSAILPDVPTLAEFNSDPGLESFFGIYAPGKTPAPIVERLSAEFVKALQAPTVRETFAKLTVVPVGSTPAEFAETIRRGKQSAGRVFKTLSIRPTEAPL